MNLKFMGKVYKKNKKHLFNCFQKHITYYRITFIETLYLKLCKTVVLKNKENRTDVNFVFEILVSYLYFKTALAN